MTSTPSGSDAPTPDDGSAEEVSAAPKKPASARPSTPRTPRSTAARPAAARKPAAKKPATSSASAAVAPDEKEPAAPAAPKKPATKRPAAAKRPASPSAEDAAAPAAAKKPAAPRKPAARATTARTGETAAKPRTASPRTKSAQAGAKTPRTTAAKTPPVAPVDAPVPVDFVIPPKPPLPPRPAPSDADQPPAIDEVIVPDQAPVEPASPEVLDEVPVVTATDAAIEEATPEPADVPSPEPVETVEEVTVVVEVGEEVPEEVTDVEVVEEVPEEAPPGDDAGDPTPADAPTPAEAEVVVVTERAEDEAAERLFADVADVVEADEPPLALEVSGLAKSYGATVAVAGIDLAVPAGTFYGLVGPNGAGKTTTLSMIAGLLKPDAGTIRVAGVDARTRSREAKKLIGVLPDRLRTFDRLTGRQLLSYAGLLRGLDANTVERRASDLGRAFDLTAALGRSVSDYSAGMTKKVMLAAALIHSPRLLVLDEPFEAVDPVSSSVILDILGTYVSHGGTVLLSSHGMDLVERVCDRVAVIVSGQVLVDGTVAEVRGEQTLEARFLELVGGSNEVEGLEWLHTFSD